MRRRRISRSGGALVFGGYRLVCRGAQYRGLAIGDLRARVLDQAPQLLAIVRVEVVFGVGWHRTFGHGLVAGARGKWNDRFDANRWSRPGGARERGQGGESQLGSVEKGYELHPEISVTRIKDGGAGEVRRIFWCGLRLTWQSFS